MNQLPPTLIPRPAIHLREIALTPSAVITVVIDEAVLGVRVQNHSAPLPVWIEKDLLHQGASF